MAQVEEVATLPVSSPRMIIAFFIFDSISQRIEYRASDMNLGLIKKGIFAAICSAADSSAAIRIKDRFLACRKALVPPR